MTLWKVDRIMNRLNEMLVHAMNGETIETAFDETKMSALETKLSHYLVMNSIGKERLEEEKKHVHELISDISHQTKTPIANMLLYSQLLEESHPTEEQKQYISALTFQAEKLSFLIDSLMKTSRLENGIIELNPKENLVALLIAQVREQAAVRAEQKNITLQFESVPDILAVYDVKWTVEALYNIVDNAIKYSKTGRTVKVSVQEYPLFCRIDVTDFGMGISEEETARIFTRFYRSQQVAEQEGVGLGLFLAREIIARQNGYIKVSSRVGEGSVFSVFLPNKI